MPDALATLGFDVDDFEKGVNKYKAQAAQMQSIAKKLNTDIKTVEKVFKDLEKQSGKTGTAHGKLATLIKKEAANFGEFGKVISNTVDALSGFGSALGGAGLAVTGLAVAAMAGTKFFIDYGSSVSDVSQNADISAESLQKLDSALEGVVKQKDADAGITSIALRLGRPRSKASEVASQLESVGIAASDLGGDPVQAMFKFLHAMAEIQDQGTRMRKMREILGDDLAVQFEPAVEQIEKVEKAYGKADAASDNSIKHAKELGTKISGVWTWVKNSALTTIGQVSDIVSGQEGGIRRTDISGNPVDKNGRVIEKTPAQKQAEEEAEKRKQWAADQLEAAKKLSNVQSNQVLGDQSRLDVINAQLEAMKDQSRVISEQEGEESLKHKQALANINQLTLASQQLELSIYNQLVDLQAQGMVLKSNFSDTDHIARIVQIQAQFEEKIRVAEQQNRDDLVAELKGQEALSIAEANAEEKSKTPRERADERKAARKKARHLRAEIARESQRARDESGTGYQSQLGNLKDPYFHGAGLGTDGGQYGFQNNVDSGVFGNGGPNMSGAFGYKSNYGFRSKSTGDAVSRLQTMAVEVLNVASIENH